MKKLVFSLLVMFVLVAVSQADRENPRGFERDAQMAGRIAEMRATLASEGHTFEIGMNEAMNYSIEQLCTLKPELAGPEDAENEPQEDLGTLMALPAAYTGYCGSVFNGSTCGAAWALVINDQIESLWRQVTGVWYNFSPQYILDCNTQGYSCSGGWFDAYSCCTYPKYFKYESCYPWVGYKKPCTAPASCNADYLSSWAYICGSSCIPTVAAIQQKVYDKGAVASAVYVDSYFQAYTGGCFSRNAAGSPNSCVLICGWDNNKCGTGIGAWKVKNYWGTSWGESGFMWIKYGCQKIGYAACYGNY